MNIRKWLCALLAVAMLCGMLPTALMEEVTASDVDAQTEEVAFELGGEPEPEDGEPVELNAFELAPPEDAAPEAPAEDAGDEPEPVKATPNGLPHYGGTVDDGTFQVNDGQLVAYTGAATAVTIPDTVTDGTNVTTITGISYSAFQGNAAITSVSIPMHVQSIDSYAFMDCTALATVTFAADSWLEDLNYGTFENCTSLSSIALPEAITEIPSGCFYGCTALKSFDLSGIKSIDEYAFAYSGLAGALDLSNVEYFSNNTFEGCTGLTSANFANNSWIENRAFAGCTGLTSLDLANVYEIGDSAFSGCTGLTSLDLANVYYIGDSAFAGCTGLTKIAIPESVENVGYAPFDGCNSITEIAVTAGENCDYSGADLSAGITPAPKVVLTDDSTAIPGGFFAGDTTVDVAALLAKVKRVGSYAFQGCTQLTEVTIPENIESMGYAVFDGCTNLTKIVVNSGEDADYGADSLIGGTTPLTLDDIDLSKAKTLPNGFFAGRTDLHRIDSTKIPASVVKIGDRAFENCTEVTEIVIPDNIKAIGDGAFSGCVKAVSLTLPSGLKTIGSEAFMNCEGITSIALPEGLESIGGVAFYNCNFKEVAIPSSVVYLGWAPFFECDYLETITVKTLAADAYKSSFTYNKLTYENHAKKVVLADGSLSVPDRFFKDSSVKSDVAIPATVTEIGEEAFHGCNGLTALPDIKNVTAIGKDAFTDCSNLTEAVLPEGLTELGESAFYSCEDLKKVVLPAGITELKAGTFEECYDLTEINLDNVTKIGQYAFEFCDGLEELTLPNKDTALGKSAIPEHVLLKCYAGSEGIEAYAKKNGNEIKYIDPVNHMTVTLTDGTTYEHTGAEIKPAVTVAFDSKALVEGTDYALSYENNVAPSTEETPAYVVVTALGDYKAARDEDNVRKVPFTITSKVDALSIAFAKPDVAPDTFYYNDGPVKPALVVKAGSNTLVEGTDYTVAYADNTGEGTATATVTVTKAGYAGEKALEFKIIQKVVQLVSGTKKISYTESKGVKFKILPPTGTTIDKITGFKKKVSEKVGADVVNPIGAGKCNIKVKCSDKKTYTIALTVVDPTQVQSVTFQAVPASVKVNETITLKWTMGPDGCDTSIKSLVSSGKKNVNLVVDAASQSATFTAAKKGTYTVTLTPNNPAKKGMKAKIKIKVVP